MTTDAAAEWAKGLFIVGGVVKSTLSDANRRVVQDHLAMLLQVQNLVILVGSGASFHLGSPQTRNLNAEAIDVLLRRAGEQLTVEDEALLFALNPNDDSDLEKLLTSLQLAATLADLTTESAITLGSGETAEAFGAAALESFRRKIGSALVEACRLPGDPARIDSAYHADPFRAHRSFLSKIVRARRSNLPRPRIFTTNYDLVLERSLDQLGYPYIDGFSGTVDRRLNLAFYGLDFHRVDSSSQQVLARADSAFYLHKIHGSLNWRARQEPDSVTGVGSLEVHQVAEDAETAEDRVLIYPTTAKEGDTLAFPYSDLMRQLGDAVQLDDTAIISVGYGFGDAHINRILLRSLAVNPALNVLVADPYAVLSPEAMASALTSPEPVGKSLTDVSPTLRDTAVASLAQARDARLAVLTGDAGRFTSFVDLLPDSGAAGTDGSPQIVADLIESLTVIRNQPGQRVSDGTASDA